MKHAIADTQNISDMCVVCGTNNDLSLKARFYNLEDGDLVGIFQPKAEHQSYPGRLHGGISSAILDETIGRAINSGNPDHDTWGVTIQLNVKFRKPVPLDGEVRAIAHITKDTRRTFEGTGQIVLDDGTVAVEATGVYVKLPADKISDGGLTDDTWFDDPRDYPAEVEL